MNISRLQEFIALATNLNYSKTANQLYITQPVLSRHIHDLEHQIGSPLFFRDTHKVQLTPVGEVLLVEARAVIAQYEASMNAVHNATIIENAQLCIGFLGAAVKPFISNFVMSFTEQHPEIQLEFRSQDADDLIKGINDDTIDLAFITHVDMSSFSGLESRSILNDAIVFACAKNHPFALKDTISVRELSDFPMISLTRKENLMPYEFNKELFKKHKANYNVVKEVPNIETAFFYASLGEGGVIIPKHLESMTDECATVPLSEDESYISLNLIWKKNNSNPATSLFQKAFIEFHSKQI